MTIQASDYQTRQDLDDYIKNELGDNSDENRKATDADGNVLHTIQGTASDLLRLHLSPSNRVYGVRVVLLDNQ